MHVCYYSAEFSYENVNHVVSMLKNINYCAIKKRENSESYILFDMEKGPVHQDIKNVYIYSNTPLYNLLNSGNVLEFGKVGVFCIYVNNEKICLQTNYVQSQIPNIFKLVTKVLVFGLSDNPIVKAIEKELEDRDWLIIKSMSDLHDLSDVKNTIERVMPHHIINILVDENGRGRYNSDDKMNVQHMVGVVNMINIANSMNIHITNVYSSLMYSYDKSHPVGGDPIKEGDNANFTDNVFVRSLINMENVLKDCDVLSFRTSQCIYKDMDFKKLSYMKTIPNSLSFLPELIPHMIDMCKKKRLGIFNLVNPGVATLLQLKPDLECEETIYPTVRELSSKKLEIEVGLISNIHNATHNFF
jgi:hypothetical protein